MRINRWLLSFLLGVLLVANVSASEFTAERYIDDVLNERVLVGRYVRLAVERHMRDLKRAESDDPQFPYYFDERQAKRVIEFKQQLRHTKGEWADPRRHDTRIRLEPWQQFSDWVLFGWRRKPDGMRRFRTAYITVARKNGKTTQAAATANALYFADRPKEYGPEIYAVGPKRDQGKILWEEAKRQIEHHPILKRKARVYKQNSVITLHEDSAARMTVWGKDAETQDGFNPSLAIIDEAHLHPGNEAMEVVESGMGARSQPLILIITTAGYDLNAAVYQEVHSLATRLLEGSLEHPPEDFFALIYALDEDDDWTEERVWVKANPNLGVSVSWEYLRNRVQQALQTPSRQNKIRTKNLNIWEQAETRWIDDDHWMKCDGQVDEEALRGRECFAGLDLSSSIDITALVLVFPPVTDGEPYQLVSRFFIPDEDLLERERRDRVPYTWWVEQGYVIATPGSVIDYRMVQQEFLALAEIYEVIEVPHDPWKAQELVNNLTDEGFEMVAIRQGYSGMAGPTETFEQKLMAGELAHAGNPVLRWMMSCTEVKSDRQGNIMPMKPQRHKNGKRIDGIVAAIMGLGRAVVRTEGESIGVWAG